MEPNTEKLIKLGLALIILIAGMSYWIIPKLKLRSKLKMNENVFIVTQLIGLICGVAGLIITFIYPNYIIELHIWEALLMPYFIIFMYWLIIMKIRKSEQLLDEKQENDMGNAGGITFAMSIIAMVVLLKLYQEGIVQGLLWFPYYLFISIIIYSGATLLFFKRR